jgi:hypothetical protein
LYLPSRDKILNKNLPKLASIAHKMNMGVEDFFYFNILNITKFGQISLWMIAT